MKKDYTIRSWEERIVPLPTGIEQQYFTCGPKEGEKILLLHGITDGHLSWYQMAPLLAEAGYYCIMPNYRGNGKTSAPDCLPEGYTAEMIAEDMFALMDREGFFEEGPVHLAGHSYGSMIAQIMALARPDSFRTLTLIGTGMECQQEGVLPEMVEEILAFTDPVSEEYVREWTLMTNEDPDFCEAVYRHTLALTATAWKNLFAGLLRFRNPNIGKTKAPILVLWGTEDNMLTAEDQAKLKEALKGKRDVTFTDMEGTGHNGYWDSVRAAEDYTAVLTAFLKDH